MTMWFKTRAPFGIQTRRFLDVGYHPGLNRNANKNKLGPGEYNFRQIPPTGSLSWKRKVDTEEFSRNLGFRSAGVLEERKFRKSAGGPGTYDVRDCGKKSASCMDNVSFGKQARFRASGAADFPPPGTYTTGLMKVEKRRFEPLPSFERDGFVDRLKSAEKPWTKPPNLYTPKDLGSIDALLGKVVSKRGPYDLFTGPRDETTIKNHLARTKIKGPDHFYVWPNEFDAMLRHPRNRTKGRFLTEARFGVATQRHMINDPTQVRKDPNEPSPVTYDVARPAQQVKVSKYAFNQSVVYARPAATWKISPGVGRYHPKSFRCSQIRRESWVFKSTIGRPEYKGPSYSAF